MAVPIPSFFKKTLQDIPEPLLETAVKKLKIDQLPVFKKFAVGKTASKTLYGDFVLHLFSLDKSLIRDIYKIVEPLLFVGGCVPAAGIAFNIIDAIFCFLLGNWLGCAVAILACIPIPGFKLAGKGFEKFFVEILKRFKPKHFLDFTKALGKKITLMKNSIPSLSYHKCYIVIREQLEKLLPSLSEAIAVEGKNVFIPEFINEFAKVMMKFPVRNPEVISKQVGKTGKYMMQEQVMKPNTIQTATSYKMNGKLGDLTTHKTQINLNK